MNQDSRMVLSMVTEMEKIYAVTSGDQYLQLSVVTLVGYKSIVTILIELFYMQQDLTVLKTFSLEYAFVSIPSFQKSSSEFFKFLTIRYCLL